MKKCDQFKDLILTDYIDGELDKNSTGVLESHLLECNDCRSFLKEVKNITIRPVQQNSKLPVPVELWDSIKQNIEQEAQRTNPFEEFIDKLAGLIVFPRIVPVFASLLLMLVVGSVSLNTIYVKQVQDKDQGEYLVSLLGSTDAMTPSDNNMGVTPIEHYFL